MNSPELTPPLSEAEKQQFLGIVSGEYSGSNPESKYATDVVREVENIYETMLKYGKIDKNSHASRDKRAVTTTIKPVFNSNPSTNEIESNKNTKIILSFGRLQDGIRLTTALVFTDSEDDKEQDLIGEMWIKYSAKNGKAVSFDPDPVALGPHDWLDILKSTNTKIDQLLSGRGQ
jgi:hypothetical protein